jgi:hypothetical protein
MREADELNAILSEWVEKAEADLACAVRLLRGTLVLIPPTRQEQ